MYKTSTSTFSPFGGLQVVHDLLKSSGFLSFIDGELGARCSTKGYTYSDCILSRIYTLYCNGSATEDVNYGIFDHHSTSTCCLQVVDHKNQPLCSGIDQNITGQKIYLPIYKHGG